MILHGVLIVSLGAAPQKIKVAVATAYNSRSPTCQSPRRAGAATRWLQFATDHVNSSTAYSGGFK
ncbi:MAG: hypothetical protein PHS33_07880 [Candidatus Omnitrophica bacterium]|nr:hypothetical protein [Candidatus Omnitrophota bacterium]